MLIRSPCDIRSKSCYARGERSYVHALTREAANGAEGSPLSSIVKDLRRRLLTRLGVAV